MRYAFGIVGIAVLALFIISCGSGGGTVQNGSSSCAGCPVIATGTTTGTTSGTTTGTTGGTTTGSMQPGTTDPQDFPPVPPVTPDDNPPPPTDGGSVGTPPVPTPPASDPGTVVGPPPVVVCEPPAPVTPPATPDPGFKPPIGIPMPPFGIAEAAPARPASWADSTSLTEVPSFFYVDGSGVCTDSPSSRFGSPGKPRCTIPLILAAGSVVEVHNTYNVSHNSPKQIQTNGTAAAPVFIRGQDNASNRPLFTRGIQVYGKYAIVENIAFDFSAQTTVGNSQALGLPGGPGADPNPTDCSTTYGNRNCSDHITFRHLDIVGNVDQTQISAVNPCVGFVIGAPVGVFKPNAVFDNIVFEDVKMKKMRRAPYDPNKDQACTAFPIGAPATNVWIMDSVCDEPVQGCVQIVASSDNKVMDLIHHIYIGRNTSYHAVKAAFTAKASHDVIFSQNVASATRETTVASGNPSPAKCFNAQYGPHDVWFIYNTCYTNTVGFYTASNVAAQPGSNTNLFWIGNQVWDIKNGGEMFPTAFYFVPYFPQGTDTSAAFDIRSGFNRWLINNTVWHSDACFYFPTNDAPGSSANLINNICGGASPITTPNPFVFSIEDTPTFDNSIIDNNLFCPSVATCSALSTDTLAGYRHGSKVEPSLKALQTNTGKCQNCLAQSPFFMDATNFDFHLTSNSPSLKGRPLQDLTPFDLFKQNYGIDIAVDHDGKPLPATGPMDVGAFQFGTGTGMGPPQVCVP